MTKSRGQTGTRKASSKQAAKGRAPSSKKLEPVGTRVRAPAEDEQQFELSLRPKRLDEYIGQGKVKENLRIFMTAARRRGEPLDHVLLTGPPGLGKTTLANIIAKEMDATLHSTAGPAIEIAGDLVGQMT